MRIGLSKLLHVRSLALLTSLAHALCFAFTACAPCTAPLSLLFPPLLWQNWQTKRINQLESELLRARCIIEQQECTIEALRAKTTELTDALQVASEEIMSNHLRTGDILKQTAHAKTLEQHPEWKDIVGVGYSEPQRRDLIYKHLQKLLDLTRTVTHGDACKAKQLIDLLHHRVHAGEHRTATGMDKAREKNNRLNKGIMLSLSDFVHRLHDAGGKGRYNEKIAQTMTVVATSVSQAAMYAKVPVKDVANALGLDARLISKCQERFNALANDGEWECLFDDRCAVRSDLLDEKWVEHALLYWMDPDLGFVRCSEKMSDAIRDPNNRNAPKQRLYSLETRIGDMYDAMKASGLKKFGDKFHLGLTKFRELRPFYVKDASRETCMCIYHLRWQQYCDALLKYRTTCRQMKVSTCSCSFEGINEKFMRQNFVCQKQSGDQKYDNVPCVTNQCSECKDCKRLTHATCGLCDDELRDPGSNEGKAIGIRYEKFTKIEYIDRHGVTKYKKDFRTTDAVPISEFVAEVRSYWPKFIAHHNDAKFLDDDWTAMKKQMPCGSVIVVMDFSENYAHEPRYEHQSKYFSQTQSTILPVVLRFRIEDMLTSPTFTAERKAELLKYCFDNNVPSVLVETHYIISNDMQHDAAFVRKALDDFITPYIKSIAPTATKLYVRSDGCKAQFKCAEAFDWTSRQSKEGCGLKVTWSFFESCHGKCDCDPEGGTLKNSARNQELRSTEHVMPTTEAFFEWAKSSSGLHTPQKSYEAKNGRGIFRRFFHFIPNKGPGSVDRAANRKSFESAKGSSQLHEFVDIGVPGTVSTRRAACHQCDACWRGDRRACVNKEYVGDPKEMTLRSKAVPITSLSRNLRSHLDSDAIQRAEKALVGSCVCIETARGEKQVPWVLGKVVTKSKPADQNTIADDLRARMGAHKTTIELDSPREAEMVLQVQLYEPIDTGSTTYTLSPLEVLIPARRIRVASVKLMEVPRVAQTQASSRPRRHMTADLPVARPTDKFKLGPEALLEIRAEMPTVDDSWDVEDVVQYRTYYRKEQWLIKWKGYGEDRNTWEPKENLLLESILKRAEEVKVKAVEHHGRTGRWI